MISFLQLNYQALISLVILVVCYFISKYWIAKFNIESEVEGIGKITKWIFLVLIFGTMAFIAVSTLHNQVPKTTIDRSFVEQSTNKYQESVINSANQGK